LLGAASFSVPAAARSTEARPVAANRATAPAPVRRAAATPARTTQARISQARISQARTSQARRETTGRSANRSRARATSTAAMPRMRDAPQELIPVLATNAQSDAAQISPRAACLLATQNAERVHGLPAGFLTAIALAESGLHAYALSIGGRPHFPDTEEAARALVASASPRRSVMAGCVQVNARVHARNSHWPLNPDISADWAGGMMARWAREMGSWPTALRRWHGGSPGSTQRLVCRVKAKLEVTSPGSDMFDDFTCAADNANRTRRNGAIHLASAQRNTR